MGHHVLHILGTARAEGSGIARIVAALRADDRRIPILDALVAATAPVEQILVITQDQDYDAIPGVEVIQV